ncbi:MAG: class I SAM-dependent methyltransferase [Chloroflexi bacterium]|nr:class I SAM-dependent methyltransferase [Chloroflexota bacterium]
MDTNRLNEEGRQLWNRKARFWDELHGDRGNLFHRRLIEPSVLQLLALQKGERVLDVGCGNGALARSLAEKGAMVSAVDFSEEMILLAEGRSRRIASDIDYRIVDATDRDALLSLGAAHFDAVVCSMTLMDIPIVAPLFEAASELLRYEGRFVFATMHPAFNSNNPVFFQEKEDRDGVVTTVTGVKIHAYDDLPPMKGSGAPGEPTPHYYYHRPLSTLLQEAFEAGFVLDGLLEPVFSPEDAELGPDLSWTKIWQIPPVLTARLRLT